MVIAIGCYSSSFSDSTCDVHAQLIGHFDSAAVDRADSALHQVPDRSYSCFLSGLPHKAFACHP